MDQVEDLKLDDLMACLREEGVDIDTFNKKGIKSFDDLEREWNELEVKFVRLPNRSLVRCAKSALISALITKRTIDYEYQEIARIYRKGEERIKVRRKRRCTASETCRQGENYREAGKRGIEEEFHGPVALEDLHYWFVGADGETFRRSSVYFALWSHTTFQHFHVDANVLGLKKREHVFIDNGTLNRIRRFELPEGKLWREIKKTRT